MSWKKWLQGSHKSQIVTGLLLGAVLIIFAQRVKIQYQKSIIESWEQTYYDSFYEIVDETSGVLENTIRLRTELTRYIINHPPVPHSFRSSDDSFAQMDSLRRSHRVQ